MKSFSGEVHTWSYERATDLNELITKIIVNIFIKLCQAIFYVSAKPIAFDAIYTKLLMIFYPLKSKQARVTHTKIISTKMLLGSYYQHKKQGGHTLAIHLKLP